MIKKNDFIEIEYTGIIEGNLVFDTTNEAIAKEQGIHNPRMKYSGMIICVGQGQVIPGLDKRLEGCEVGQQYTFDIPAEEAFGKKDPKLIQLISTAKFKKANISPMPGLQINIDNQLGTIKTVSGGRTLVDFNHPLSGKNVRYTLKITRSIEDTPKRLSVLAGALLQIEEPEVTLAEGKAQVQLAFELSKEVGDILTKKILEVLPELKEVSFHKVETLKEGTKEKVKKEPNKVSRNSDADKGREASSREPSNK